VSHLPHNASHSAGMQGVIIVQLLNIHSAGSVIPGIGHTKPPPLELPDDELAELDEVLLELEELLELEDELVLELEDDELPQFHVER
jgi:hypothetical protein